MTLSSILGIPMNQQVPVGSMHETFRAESAQLARSSRPDGSATFKCHGTQSFGSDLTRAVWTTGGVAGWIFGERRQDEAMLEISNQWISRDINHQQIKHFC